MNTFTQRFQAGGFNRWQPVAQHRSEDVDHLAIAIGRAFGELAADLGSRPAGSTQSLKGAPFLEAHQACGPAPARSAKGRTPSGPCPKQRLCSPTARPS